MCTACAKKNNSIGKAMKKRRKTTKRRSRVGAVSMTGTKSGLNIERALTFAVGAVATEYVVNVGLKALNKDGKNELLNSSYVSGVAKIGMGVAGMMYSKNPMLRDAAAGAFAAGGLDLARKVLKVPGMNGIGDVEFYNDDSNVGNTDFYQGDSDVDSDQP